MNPPIGYTERLNPSRASRSIEAVWTFLAGDVCAHRVLPDGRCDLILRYETGHNGGCTEVTPLIAGPSTTYHMVPLARGTGFVGVRLRPGFAKPVLGVDPARIVDKTLSGEAALAVLPSLASLSQPANSIEELIARVIRFVVQDRDTGAFIRTSVRSLSLIDALHVGGGRLSVADLAQMYFVDERTVRRDVKVSTGLSPKQFSTVIQFHHAIHLLRDANLDPVSAAIEAGYADQAHMTRAFKKLGGFTPAHIPEVALAGLPLTMSDLFKTANMKALGSAS